MRFTDEYKALQKQLHSTGTYGVSGHKHAERISDLARRMGTRSVLDYGCGQHTLAQKMPFKISEYDPFLEGYDAEPEQHDLVVCSDVLEHIEPECLQQVLDHLRYLSKKALFVDIATRPAKKVLADGRNAHLIQISPIEWLDRLSAVGFHIGSVQVYEGGLVALFGVQ